jgi:predicted RNase H-like HicB family nuclease
MRSPIPILFPSTPPSRPSSSASSAAETPARNAYFKKYGAFQKIYPQSLDAIPPTAQSRHMKARFTYWQEEDGMFLGYLNEFPEHWSQGDDLDDLKIQLLELHQNLTTEIAASAQRDPVLSDLTD